MTHQFESVLQAIEQLRAGGVVVAADDADRENEGDLICAAETMTDERMAFFLRRGSGIVCVPMNEDRATRLDLDLMVRDNTERYSTAFTVSVDHVDVSSGISAADRALTVRALADPSVDPAALRRPGHVFPLRARRGGVLKRQGHTEAATDLVSLAGRSGVGVITELVGDDGTPVRGRAIPQFADAHGLPFLEIADLVRYQRVTASVITRTGHARLPTDHGEFDAWSFRSVLDGAEHFALTMGDLAEANQSPEGTLVRVHSECLTGDLFGSHRCDCGSQLQNSLKIIAKEGAGVLVYLRGHEGRGIGLGHKLQAYQLQDQGRDTVDANLELGLPIDTREYGVGAAILTQLGVFRLRLITNNPDKYCGLSGYDLELMGRIPSIPSVTVDNIRYLRTKRDRLGHLLDLPETGAPLPPAAGGDGSAS